MSKNVWNLLAVLLTATALSACSKPNDGPSTESSSYLSIKGSDTMVHLVSDWAEAYMKDNPDADLSVTGGGSGTGIAALLNGTTDIAMASRSMKQKEHDLAEKQGMEIEEIVVARDGIAMVVNPANSVNELTIKQLGDIFAGKTTNWSEVGGPDESIALLSRESSSGTYVFVQKRVLGKRDYASSARLMPATSGVIQAVTTEKGSIGYVGLGYLTGAGDQVRAIAVKDGDAGDPIAPTVESVKSGSYAIARPLHLYMKKNGSQSVRDFVKFCLGPDGQHIVSEAGYVPVENGAK
ncbi:MAG: PstS family phosphate ABC transporter substrate-binding protein [Candidatus Hydrogenedentes bacterium]|nr:PstS family phosphate ABC transporter substrate-binding protein [Candidatus Hydrogenedentota bacterium]